MSAPKIRSFIVNAKPEGQPRVRPIGGHRGWYVPRTAFFQACVWQAKAAKPPQPLDGPLRLEVAAVMPRPKSAPKWKHWHTAPPDADNITKGVKDAMTHAGWWKSDALVCDERTTKRLAKPGEAPHAVVMVYELTEEESK